MMKFAATERRLYKYLVENSNIIHGSSEQLSYISDLLLYLR